MLSSSDHEQLMHPPYRYEQSAASDVEPKMLHVKLTHADNIVTPSSLLITPPAASPNHFRK